MLIVKYLSIICSISYFIIYILLISDWFNKLTAYLLFFYFYPDHFIRSHPREHAGKGLPPCASAGNRPRSISRSTARGFPQKGKRKTAAYQSCRSAMVGLVGLEPMTFTMSTWRSNQLSYNPSKRYPLYQKSPFLSTFNFEKSKSAGKWIPRRPSVSKNL